MITKENDQQNIKNFLMVGSPVTFKTSQLNSIEKLDIAQLTQGYEL